MVSTFISSLLEYGVATNRVKNSSIVNQPSACEAPCKTRIFVSPNQPSLAGGFLSSWAWHCHQHPREAVNLQAAHETQHAAASMQGIIRHLWWCKSSGTLKLSVLMCKGRKFDAACDICLEITSLFYHFYADNTVALTKIDIELLNKITKWLSLFLYFISIFLLTPFFSNIYRQYLYQVLCPSQIQTFIRCYAVID